MSVEIAPDSRTGDLPASGTCLVTGASGFIGAHVVERLVKEGYRVRCLVRQSSDTSLLEKLGVELAVGDLHNADSLARAVESSRYVVHCAALVSDWATTQEIKGTNVDGTHNLLEASVATSVKRFVHVSSTDIYGHPDTEIDETYTSTRFANWYSQTKLLAEEEVHRAGDSSTMEIVILRPATVYGPGSEDVIGEIARAIRGGHMLLIDRGRVIAGLCYVENLVDAVLLALEHPNAPGEAFNVTDGLPVTWRELADDLARGLDAKRVRWSMPYWLAGSIGFALEHGYRALRRTTGLEMAPLLSRQAVQVLGRDQNFSNHKARERIGWKPRVDYHRGLKATLQWLCSDYLKDT
ncbi:MAG: NAD-dependent epimerase/dehydratase family protein [Solirubrobacteraceae bacterium]